MSMTSSKQGGGSLSGEGVSASLSDLTLSHNDVAILAETFRLLGDPSRLRILLYCMHGPVSVGEIVEGVELSQSLVSHHLRLLRGARLVRGTRRSKQVFYEISDEHVSQMLTDMATHISEEHED